MNERVNGFIEWIQGFKDNCDIYTRSADIWIF